MGPDAEIGLGRRRRGCDLRTDRARVLLRGLLRSRAADRRNRRLGAGRRGALTTRQPLPTSLPGRLALGGLALLTAWVGLSIAWAPIGGRAQDDLQRLLLYLGFLFVATVVLRGPQQRRWLEPALVLGAFVVIAYALSERLLPGLIELARSESADGRLEQPISYWNALGLLAAIGLVLAIRVAGDPERERWMRAASAAAGVALGLGVYLSFSRGALAAVAAGVLFLIALAPHGRPQLQAAVGVVAASGLAALVASLLPTVQSIHRGDAGDSTEGLIMFGALILLAGAAAWVSVLPPVKLPRRTRGPSLPVSRATAVLTVAGALIVAAALAAAVLRGQAGGDLARPGRRSRPARLDRHEPLPLLGGRDRHLGRPPDRRSRVGRLPGAVAEGARPRRQVRGRALALPGDPRRARRRRVRVPDGVPVRQPPPRWCALYRWRPALRRALRAAWRAGPCTPDSTGTGRCPP